jgi:hypothetical protein
MPMREVAPEAAGVRVDWTSDPSHPRPGQMVTFSYRVVDLRTEAVVTDLPLTHERPMHLILISRSLTHFAHVHPELGDDGAYRVETMLSETGTYLLYAEFVHDGRSVLDRRALTVGEQPSAAVSLVPDLTPKTVNGVTIAVEAPEVIHTGKLTRFTFTLTREGTPLTDLVPYLGAAAHVAIVSEDANDFAHAHGEAVRAASAGDDHGADDHGHHVQHGHAIPSAFGPEIRVEHTFPAPGRYRMWVQVGHAGTVLTVPFTVKAR